MDWPRKIRERRAKGMVTGTERRMAMGWTKLSNWAARIMYMKMREKPKAMRKAALDSFWVLARPLAMREYWGPVLRSLKVLEKVSWAMLVGMPARLATREILRWRAKRSIWDGPRASPVVATFDSLIRPALVEGRVRFSTTPLSL